MADNKTDIALLKAAVLVSRQHMEAGDGGPFGALVADGAGNIIAEGWNCVTLSNDPTAHAEVAAIRRACEKLGSYSLRGHVLYSSCEPCPMCLAAIYWARLDRLVFANSREEAAAIGFDDALIYAEIPKPITERIIPTEHLPMDEGSQVFADWLKKADRTHY